MTDFFTQWTTQSILVRILISAFLGAIIGIDRGVTRRGGGSKTTMSVCLGATLVMLTEQFCQMHYPGTADATRMAAQVISGVGFLGVGTIIVSGHKVKGLSSAASIWTCACIGLATGIGFIVGAVVVTCILLFCLHLLPHIENAFYKHTNYISLYIEVENGKAITSLLHRVRDDGCSVDSFDVEKPKAKGQYFTVMTVLRTPRRMNAEDYMEELREMKGIISVDDM